ncbi:lipase/acylhydrolase [Fictibacillus macauensis ZFHKF-1]|uniref:Lipase/acylhydrolase n=1 Tax=Fictibacillus macauensis ZFHKF-1 TaxID=1196324 RepID=I8J1X7_9BACL|nr:GDSL-type esterase/lipase family protein [Fictibacillus macauensis]EIT85751.1 lipase/acylhydrolase [Fictibacillus macauensis ZFHKF-1]
MKKWVLIPLILLLICLGGAGAWYYYPQYKINKMKAANSVENDDSNHKASSKDSYINHLKKAKSHNLHHLALGDSVIQGRGSSKGGFVKEANQQLMKLTGKKIILDNEGISGATSKDLLTFVQSPKMRERLHEADLITINIGGNDLVKLALKEGVIQALQDYQQVKSSYEENLTAIFQYIRKENPNAILVYDELYNAIDSEESFYPATKKLLNDWNLIAYEVTDQYRPSVVIPSSEALTTDDRKDWIYDSIHPNETGHKRIAAKMVRALQSPYKKE